MTGADRLAAKMGWRDGVQGLLGAYAIGAFPMGDPRTGRLDWYDPDPRAVMPMDERFHVSRSLAKRMRSGRFEVTSDEAFGEVLRACAEPRADANGEDEAELQETWIDDTIIGAYEALHAAGHAHSVEVWRRDDGGSRRLVGGIYGVTLGGLFAGESMFSRPASGGRDASKVALVWCWRVLRACGFVLFDVQFWTPHLGRFGCVEMPRASYHARLAEACTLGASWRAALPRVERLGP
ncbi:MAG: leucyl/phenylalanyl-tRNA--protein transferase [Planctomycetota bacterium]